MFLPRGVVRAAEDNTSCLLGSLPLRADEKQDCSSIHARYWKELAANEVVQGQNQLCGSFLFCYLHQYLGEGWKASVLCNKSKW